MMTDGDGTDLECWALKDVKVCSHAVGAVVLVSVAVLDPAGWYPFTVAKWWIVALAITVSWWTARRAAAARLPRWPLWLTIVFVGLMAIAAVFGRDPLYAWTGTPERHFGVIGWVVMLAAFSTGPSIAKPERLEIFMRWVVVAGGVAGVYALVERWWRPPVTTSGITDRLGGPYGSASIFGAALCLLVPLCLAATVGLRSVWWRYAAAGASAGCIAAVVGTGTRAAWVGLAVAAVMALPRVCKRRPSPMLAAGVAIGAAVAASGLIAGGAEGIADRTAGSSSRLAEWGVGVRVIKEHLWLGVGPEGYRTALADGVTANYERTYGREVLPDRAHNVLIDVAATGGVLAAALYVAIGAVVLVGCWQAIRRGTSLQAGVGLAVIAYGVQSAFLFPVATVDPILWLLAGAVITVNGPVQAPTVRADSKTRRLLLDLAAAGAAMAIFTVGVVSVAADRAARQAVGEQSAASAERAVSLRPDVVRYRLLLATLRPGSVEGRRAQIADMQAALDISPLDPIVRRQAADSLTRLAVATGDLGDVVRARDAWQSLSDDDLNCYQCALGLGYALALDGDHQGALGAFERAASLEAAGDVEAAMNVAQLREVIEREQSGGT